ncbi:MAG: helix-turn-helix domain-containing protein [Alistipes sp.]|jgi:transcriptional regulator GlxA family with amidase domain|nr:helix-turn-helix domain-containing protein [Alistipes sp.]
MKEAPYPPKSPAGAFTVTVERTVVYDSRERMHHEYSYTVAAAPSGCDFLDMFAALVTRRGNSDAKHYAAWMGVDARRFNATVHTLSGVGVLAWTDEFAGAVATALLRQTDWPVARVARAALMSSPRAFNSFFRRRYGCTPQQFRWKG